MNNTNLHYLDQAQDQAERLSPGTELMAWLRDAQYPQVDPIGDWEIGESPGEPPPKFPTGLSGWEDKTDGGGYGCTCISGQPKAGKSFLAMSCAIEAARANVPWRVLYFPAENSRYETITRLHRYLGSPPPKSLSDQLSFHPTGRGVSPDHVFLKVGDRIHLDDERLLLVFDSINRIVKQSRSSGSDSNYWATMERWIEFGRMAAMLSGGRIASVIVSELAAAGHVKGRDIEYAADLVVRITAVDGDDEYRNVSIPYARSSAGGKLGMHYLDWKHGRFTCVDSDDSGKRTQADVSWV